jgi:dolichol-phosphate mannosyltransferase
MISIVLPTRNEPGVGQLITAVHEVLTQSHEPFEIVVIDKSDDDTPERARAAGAAIHRQTSEGLGGALKEGLRIARGDIVFAMDADFSHDPKYIPDFLNRMREGFDLVIGSRKIPGGGVVGWNRRRKLVSGGANFVAHYIAGIDVSDLTSGFRAYRATMLSDLNLETIRSSSYAFQLEVTARAVKRGFKVGVVPIVFPDRHAGKSKLSRKDIVDFFYTALKIRFAS